MTTQISGTTGVSRVQDGSVVQADLAANVAGNGPAFTASSAAGVAGLVSGTPTKVPFGAETHDATNNYDPALSRFTAPVAGYYQFNAKAKGAVASGTLGVVLLFFVNGAPTNSFAASDTTFLAQRLVLSETLYLTAGQYVEVFMSVYGTTPSIVAEDRLFSGFLARAA